MIVLVAKVLSTVVLLYLVLTLWLYLFRKNDDGPPDLSDRNPGGM
jgi:hypothetical protein